MTINQKNTAIAKADDISEEEYDRLNKIQTINDVDYKKQKIRYNAKKMFYDTINEHIVRLCQ